MDALQELESANFARLHRLQHGGKSLTKPKLGGSIVAWAANEIEAARAGLTGIGWQSIDTAPAAQGSDDPKVLIWGPRMPAVELALPDGDWWRKRAKESGGGSFITHWMPLPTAPTQGGEVDDR